MCGPTLEPTETLRESLSASECIQEYLTPTDTQIRFRVPGQQAIRKAQSRQKRINAAGTQVRKARVRVSEAVQDVWIESWTVIPG